MRILTTLEISKYYQGKQRIFYNYGAYIWCSFFILKKFFFKKRFVRKIHTNLDTRLSLRHRPHFARNKFPQAHSFGVGRDTYSFDNSDHKRLSLLSLSRRKN